MRVVLTERDQQLIDVLTQRVRLLRLSQVTLLFWPNGNNQRCTRRRLEHLQQAGWIEIHCIMAHPPLPAVRPLASWKPGDDEPEIDRLTQQIRSRWKESPVRTMVVVASSETAGLFGSTSFGLPRQEHWNHDLRLADVFVWYCRNRPKLAAQWVGEHGLPKAGYGIKDPDAFLVDSTGQCCRVIESAGRYSVSQVQSFHDHCVEHQLPYELW